MIDDTTVLGLFKTRAEAEAAIHALQDAGFDSDAIGFLAPGAVEEPPAGRTAARGVAAGTGAGAVAGGILGALATGLIPGIGPFVAGGFLVPLLIGIATGASTGGLAGGLISGAKVGSVGLYYQQQVESGSSLVAVKAGPQASEADAILKAHGAFGEPPAA
ncbi:MAG TPA: hypothetical protein VF160_04315 [Candidatus Dormibacteraeota bacterium]